MAMTNVFKGAHGSLMLLQEAAAQFPAAGEHAAKILEAYTDVGEVVGRITDVTVRVQTRLEAFHELGRRHPVSLHPGDINISGTVSRAYINGALLTLLLGKGADVNEQAEPYPQPSLLMNLILQDQAKSDNRALLKLGGVKFENWAYTLPEDDFVLENVSFKALTIKVQDEEDGTVQSVAFPE